MHESSVKGNNVSATCRDNLIVTIPSDKSSVVNCMLGLLFLFLSFLNFGVVYWLALTFFTISPSEQLTILGLTFTEH